MSAKAVQHNSWQFQLYNKIQTYIQMKKKREK